MKRDLEQTISATVQKVFGVETEVDLTRPEEQFGDYATNVALQLAKQLGQKPRDVAEELVVKLRENFAEQISDISVAGPGFINVKLTDTALIASLDVKPQKSLTGKTIAAEYSDPNPFKVLHAGHLYTTLVGDAIARLLEQAGAQVHRLNYGGDVGLHVGKTMWAILRELDGENPEKLSAVDINQRLEWLSARYVEGNNAYKDDEAAKSEIVTLNKQIYQLHTEGDHESKFAQIYWTCREWSYEGFDLLYEQLQVERFERYIPESESTPIGVDIVEQGLSKGVFKKSDGAVVFEGEPHGLHTRVFMNSEGLPTYEAKDLGLAALKWRDYHFDRSIIITANDIVEYMKVVLKALGHFHPEIVERSEHLTHGMIKLPGGTKMSSREGNVLRAVDILNAAEEANKKLTGQDNPETVLGAVKYAFLKTRTGGDIVYDPVESVSLEGNSGPYLQYAHARARSILRKAHNTTKVSVPPEHSTGGAVHPPVALAASYDTDTLVVCTSGERPLARKISEYAEVIDKAVVELMPHHICTYLYELAQTFNRFYEHSRVVGDERQALRLSLVERYAETLKAGLSLLGIASPDKM